MSFMLQSEVELVTDFHVYLRSILPKDPLLQI